MTPTSHTYDSTPQQYGRYREMTVEDLLLENYSWADRSQGKVRIPIDRAIQLLAQRGLPVAPAVEQAPLLTGEQRPANSVPLTSGFARTGYELDAAAALAASCRC